MSTAGEKRDPRLPRPSRVAKVAVATLAMLILLSAGGAFAYDQARKDEIAPGVRMAGIDIGGQDVERARKLIREDVVAPLMRPVTVTFEGREFKLTRKGAGMKADLDGMVEEAVEASRDGGLPARLVRYASGGRLQRDLSPRVAYSEEKLDAFVDRVAEKVNREPRDATIIPTGSEIRPEKEQDGVDMDEEKLRRDVERALQSPPGARRVRVSAERTEPDVTIDELAREYPVYLTVDRTNFKLTLWRNLERAKTYTIAVGKIGYETPSGLYTVNDKQVNPTWYVPDSDWAGSLAGAVIPPGPSNPLKARWMGFFDGAGVHGTDDISSLGTAASHACIRMAVPDVVELYERVPVGTPIYIG